MAIETISGESHEDYEIHTCDSCGRKTMLNGVGGDVACCPCEFEDEGS